MEGRGDAHLAYDSSLDYPLRMWSQFLCAPQEQVLDYCFSHMGIKSDRVNHPVIITECVCNPNHSRHREPHVSLSRRLLQCMDLRFLPCCGGVDSRVESGKGGIKFSLSQHSFLAVCLPVPVFSEMLFFRYGVPKVCFGVDSLFSMYWHKYQSIPTG